MIRGPSWPTLIRKNIGYVTGSYRGNSLLSYRDYVLNLLVQKVGFRFNEGDLSPVLRRKVSELVDMRQGTDARQNQIPQKHAELAHLKSQKENNTIYLAILLIVGFILLIVIFGVALLVWAYFVYRQRQRINTQILQTNNYITQLNTEINSLNYTFNQRLDLLCQEIQAELSAAYIMKPKTLQQSQTQPVQTITAPPPVQVQPLPPRIEASPNVQSFGEGTMITCAYCVKLFPQTLTRCPYCGADREY